MVNLENLIEKKNRKGTLFYENLNGVIEAKVCAKCNEVKFLGDYQKHKAGLGGRESTCKLCRSGYYEDNKDQFVERYEVNKERIRKVQREYYNANKEQILEYSRQYYDANKEHCAEKSREWRDNNKGYFTEYARTWRRDNPEKCTLHKNRRRARKKSLPDNFTIEQMECTIDYFDGCALTGATNDLHWDHVIPLATGHGGTTYGNMIPLRGDLNISKKDANIFEWFETNRQRFKLSEERFNRAINWVAEATGMSCEEYRKYVYECFENKKEVVAA